jgi:hypothetical protein
VTLEERARAAFIFVLKTYAPGNPNIQQAEAIEQVVHDGAHYILGQLREAVLEDREAIAKQHDDVAQWWRDRRPSWNEPPSVREHYVDAWSSAAANVRGRPPP